MLNILIIAAAAAAVPTTPSSCKPGGTIADGYARAETWYVNSDAITISKRRYAKYGLPRVLDHRDVVGLTVYRGANVYVEPRVKRPPEVIYVLVGNSSPGQYIVSGPAPETSCEYQPYLLEPSPHRNRR